MSVQQVYTEPIHSDRSFANSRVTETLQNHLSRDPRAQLSKDVGVRTLPRVAGASELKSIALVTPSLGSRSDRSQKPSGGDLHRLWALENKHLSDKMRTFSSLGRRPHLPRLSTVIEDDDLPHVEPQTHSEFASQNVVQGAGEGLPK
eukprot:5576992-Pyramimonas_sp.AAC.1